MSRKTHCQTIKHLAGQADSVRLVLKDERDPHPYLVFGNLTSELSEVRNHELLAGLNPVWIV